MKPSRQFHDLQTLHKPVLWERNCRWQRIKETASRCEWHVYFRRWPKHPEDWILWDDCINQSTKCYRTSFHAASTSIIMYNTFFSLHPGLPLPQHTHTHTFPISLCARARARVCVSYKYRAYIPRLNLTFVCDSWNILTLNNLSGCLIIILFPS